MAAKTLDEAQPSEASDQRRDQMLIAAAELIAERGFSETRIADVARRVGASPALVIYYFGTKDSLLTAALRYSEEQFYTSCAEMLAKTADTRDRLESLARMTCVPDADEGITGTWGLWFDLWAQAFRHPEVGRDRVELERRWRTTIEDVVRQGIEVGDIDKVDPEDFAVTWAVLLDGLSIQVALRDEKVDPERAVTIAMRMAQRELNLAPSKAKKKR
jgi:AcrR family transcriptional regulator